jgi:uncharacterized protein
MNLTVESLWRYPITGGPGIAVQHIEVTASGFEGDRTFLLAEKTEGGFRRLGSKQAPKLFGLQYKNEGRTVLLDGEEVELPYPNVDVAETSELKCDEFGDSTPVVRVGDHYDRLFCDYLDREVTLFRKAASWLLGQGIAPENRANAPLHILSNASVVDIANKSNTSPDARRYRPNIVMDGLNPHEELNLIGRTLRFVIGVIQVDRGTPRCPVPSYDPSTGENLKDISLKDMPKSANRAGKDVASAGVYAHPLNPPFHIGLGDVITIDS